MAWSTDAARPLTEAFTGALGAPGTVIAVACIDDAGTVTQVNPGDTPADGRFEVGSVTKTMTATLLALLAADGSLRLDDEVGRWLPAGVNAGITLRQLATHSSGLPRLAPNMGLPTVDLANPYGEFGAEQAEEGLRQAVAAPGAPVLYSNFGYQLLGLVAERASGLPYEQLITERLLTPLGMSCSGAGSNASGTPLPGHDHRGELPHWDHPLAAAGGVEATIGDLARYASACLCPPRSPLGGAIAAAQTPQLPVEAGGHMALAWRVSDDGIRWHTGSTGGFSAAMLIDPARGRAIAMLASCFGRGRSLRQAGLLTLAGEDPRAARPGPSGTSAPARSSGCCWTGGPRRSRPAPRTPSGNGCSPSGWTCPGATGRGTSATGRFPGQQLAVRPRGHGRHHDHVRQRHARPADRLLPVRPGLRHEPAVAATLTDE